MTELSGLRRGDRVRVVLEGPVSVVTSTYFIVGPAASGNAIFPPNDHVVSIEKLAPPLKAGDTLSFRDYAAAPVGTVARAGNTGKTITKHADQHWYFSGESEPASPWTERTVLHVPDVAA